MKLYTKVGRLMPDGKQFYKLFDTKENIEKKAKQEERKRIKKGLEKLFTNTRKKDTYPFAKIYRYRFVSFFEELEEAKK